MKSTRRFSRVISEDGIAFARGTRVEMELDEEQFVGGGVYLFASVIEYFLALYASLNSFSQLSARMQQRKEVLREWPPRAGQQDLDVSRSLSAARICASIPDGSISFRPCV